MEMMPGVTKIEFAMGSHGLEWKDTEVTRSTMQAYALGVRAGWTISMINGNECQTSADVREQLNQAKKHGKKYPIIFVKDAATIRSEQAKAEADKQKKEKEEAERKAKEEKEKKAREEAEKKKADELAAKKQEYWDKQEAAKTEGGGEAPPAEAPPAE
eukprot:gnl/MRDRNA2_/MRDRNA2_87639_c0_seq1.p1 gnl/MRDRNA2_/MRDRNA2_87639_c0~~gnl/MRDRNA2_/MRDRNA2_87639_c0_seq1.p1  ORF type:complete len:158 (-),score=64.08 gnl/MRDRNA2_/MRDRNA2_87639_c0_seq1:219-692(-)